MSNTPIARAVAIRGAESVTAPDRCPTCDRDIADASTIGEGLCEVQVSFDSKQRRAGGWNLAARKDCETVHRVDWRARALAAEARIATTAAAIEHDIAIKLSHDSARSTGGQTVGTGGPLTGAPQSCIRYLDRVVRDLHDDRTRAIADHAAQWAKVAPLIERLRHTRRHTKPEFVVAAIDALLAATEATP